MFRTVVVATDGSASAERAEQAGVDLAARFDADLHALSVATDGQATHEEARAAVADLAGLADRAVVTAVRAGEPVDVICEYAAALDDSVVVMGTRGRGGPHKFHLGSVAEAVVHDCPVPVLTVRGEE